MASPTKSTRVLLLISALAIASIGVGGVVYAISSMNAEQISAGTGRLEALRGGIADLELHLQIQDTSLDDYVLSGAAVARKAYDQAQAVVEADVRLLGSPAATYPAVIIALNAVTADLKDWEGNVAGPILTAVALGDKAAIDAFRTTALHDRDNIDASIRALDGSLDLVAQLIRRQQDSAATVTLIGTIAAFGFLAVSFGVALFVVRRFGRAVEQDAGQASIVNRFTELASFAKDDVEVAAANLVALERLVAPDGAVTHILNRSLDRATPEAQFGEALAEVLPLHDLNRCAGVIRGSMYVADDLSDALSVHCPVYRATTGTLACIPLVSGEPVGAVHLYWSEPNALRLSERPSVLRLTEHAALTIGNRRLLAALHGQANTDARTGLQNSRSFDLALEEALTTRTSSESVAVLMIDIDQFKDFNDRHGHPAGDEVLRTFAGVLRSCMREDDVAARYGGEEFAVLLPGATAGVAKAIAERIRSRTESTTIVLAPGQTDRITISIGYAVVPDDAVDRVSLLRLSDEALYRAKDAGRNRIEGQAAAA